MNSCFANQVARAQALELEYLLIYQTLDSDKSTTTERDIDAEGMGKREQNNKADTDTEEGRLLQVPALEKVHSTLSG